MFCFGDLVYDTQVIFYKGNEINLLTCTGHELYLEVSLKKFFKGNVTVRFFPSIT